MQPQTLECEFSKPTLKNKTKRNKNPARHGNIHVCNPSIPVGGVRKILGREVGGSLTQIYHTQTNNGLNK